MKSDMKQAKNFCKMRHESCRRRLLWFARLFCIFLACGWLCLSFACDVILDKQFYIVFGIIVTNHFASEYFHSVFFSLCHNHFPSITFHLLICWSAENATANGTNATNDNVLFRKVIILSHYGYGIIGFFSLLISIWANSFSTSAEYVRESASVLCTSMKMILICCRRCHWCCCYFSRFHQFRRRMRWDVSEKEREREKNCWRINKFVYRWFELNIVA